MASYHFPIILGQNKKERIVIIHLTDDAEDYQENRVVVVSNSQNEPLFRIPKKAQMIHTDGNDFQAINQLTVTDTSGKIAKIDKEDFYEYTVEDNKNCEYDGKIEFIYQTYKGSLHIIRTDDSNVLRLNIDLGSEATQATCFCSHLNSWACLPINLVDAIKGTYANRNYNSLTRPNVGTLFTQEDEVCAHYYKTGNITFHEYSDDSYGVLSLNKQTKEKEEQTKEKEQPFINFLNVSAAGKNANDANNVKDKEKVWEEESDYSKKLPNIKVLYTDPIGVSAYSSIQVQYRDCPDDKIGHSLNNQNNISKVLGVIYKQIIAAAETGLKQFSGYQPQKIKAISALILVPNIYTQGQIDTLLYELNKLNNQKDDIPAEKTPAPTDTDTDMTTPTPQSLTPPPHIPTSGTTDSGMRYDFRVISESDAAFLGVKTVGLGGNGTILQKINDKVDDEKQKDAYLIIDSGKGTTDFSIINYNPGDPNSSIASYKRGGIAGAGGAIDYVFARIIARQIYKRIEDKKGCDEDWFVKRFMEMIAEMAPRLQDSVMRLIEEAKKNYNVEKGEIPDISYVVEDNNNQSAENKVKAYGAFPVEIVQKILDKDESYEQIFDLREWSLVEKYVWNKKSFIQLEENDKKEIDSVCNMIAKETIDKIFGKNDEHKHITNRIDFVIMTGRSFLFIPLRLAFEKMLNEKRGVFRVNFSNWWTFKFSKKANPNLNIDDTTGKLNMKEVSVMFSERDLGYNCNSDLCCLDSLKLINSDKKFDFKQENFWNGFTFHDGERTYYIGFPGKPFAGRDVQGNVEDQTPGIVDLKKMTLFPITYIEVNL